MHVSKSETTLLNRGEILLHKVSNVLVPKIRIATLERISPNCVLVDGKKVCNFSLFKFDKKITTLENLSLFCKHQILCKDLIQVPNLCIRKILPNSFCNNKYQYYQVHLSTYFCTKFRLSLKKGLSKWIHQHH